MSVKENAIDNVIIDVMEVNCINMKQEDENVLTHYFRDFLMGSHVAGLQKATFNTDNIPALVSKGLSGFTVEITPHRDNGFSPQDKSQDYSIYRENDIHIVGAWEIRCKKHSEVSALIAFYTENH